MALSVLFVSILFPVKCLADVTNEVQKQVNVVEELQTDTKEEAARMQQLTNKRYKYMYAYKQK